jgi:hypothetical protein
VDDNRDVGISSQGMDEMIASFTVTITVSGGHNGRQFRICQVDPYGDGDGPTMKPVKKITLQVMWQLSRLPDSRYQTKLAGSLLQIHKGLFKCLQNPEIGTTRAPLDFGIALEVFLLNHEVASLYIPP